MHYLVTGGCGFIGSNYVRGLLSGRWGQEVRQVSVVDKLTYAGNLDNLREVNGDPRLCFYKDDILDTPRMKKLLQGVDVVVHFAAESHVDRSIQSASPFILTNVLGTQNLLECARNAEISVFVHVSTDEVYGSIEEGSWTEEEPLLPNSPYAASKASSDLIARAFHQTYGMDIRVTRCSNNFGTHQYPEKMIPLFVTNLIDDVKVPLYGDGQNVRDWLHVNDHCRGIDLVARTGRGGQIYNIGGGTELTNLDLTCRLLELFGKGEEFINPVQDRLGHDRRYSVNWTKIHRELGYEPSHSIDTHLEEIVHWYKNNEQWWRPLKK